ncbi:hypothetical protein CCL13_11995, partial [Pseudomonas syringae]
MGGRHTGLFDDDMRPTPKHLALYTVFVGASLLAKAIAQTPCFLRLHWPIREQARSHRTGALRGMHTGVIDDDMRAHAEAFGVVHRFCGSDALRGMHTSVIDDDMRAHAKAPGVVHKSRGSELARESDC